MFVESDFKIIYGPFFPYKGDVLYNKEIIYSIVEESARVCYKSTFNNLNLNFINSLLKSKHTSVLEHAPIYELKTNDSYNLRELIEKKYSNIYISLLKYELSNSSKPETIISFILDTKVSLFSNWNNITGIIPFLEQYMSVYFIIDRAIANELVRHRKMSFSQESTRYCNYTKDKFGGITFIIPSGIQEKKQFKEYCNLCEAKYVSLIDQGYKPEDARSVLPLCTKTELIMTGKIKDWIWVFMNRAFDVVGRAHPDMKYIMRKLTDYIIPIWIKNFSKKDIEKFFINDQILNKGITEKDIKNKIFEIYGI